MPGDTGSAAASCRLNPNSTFTQANTKYLCHTEDNHKEAAQQRQSADRTRSIYHVCMGLTLGGDSDTRPAVPSAQGRPQPSVISSGFAEPHWTTELECEFHASFFHMHAPFHIALLGVMVVGDFFGFMANYRQYLSKPAFYLPVCFSNMFDVSLLAGRVWLHKLPDKHRAHRWGSRAWVLWVIIVVLQLGAGILAFFDAANTPVEQPEHVGEAGDLSAIQHLGGYNLLDDLSWGATACTMMAFVIIMNGSHALPAYVEISLGVCLAGAAFIASGLWVVSLASPSDSDMSIEHLEFELIRAMSAASMKNGAELRLFLWMFSALTLVMIASMLWYRSMLGDRFLADKRAAYFAEERLREQERFASFVFHEVRNNLNVMCGTIHWALDGVRSGRITIDPSGNDKDEDETALLRYADAHARHASQVMNNMLVYTKIQAGKFDAPAAPFSVLGVLNECITLTVHMCHEKAVKLRLEASEAELPRQSLGSSAHLTQLLVNLLTNALKYTDTGEVVLSAKVLHAASGKRTTPLHATRIEFAVEDTGCGVSAEKQVQVSEAWEQGCQPGTGLGLALCKRLVESMSGDLKLESPVASTGIGSRFSFVIELGTLDARPSRVRTPKNSPKKNSKKSPARGKHSPAKSANDHDENSDGTEYQSAEDEEDDFDHQQPAPPPVVQHRATLADSPTSPCAQRILVVDDHSLNRKLLIATLRRVMSKQEVAFVEASTGEEALKLLRTGSFDVAFLDEQLSHDPKALKGTDVSRLYRASEGGPCLDPPWEGGNNSSSSGNNGQQCTRLSTVIVGLTGDAGLNHHDEFATSAGQDAVWGKPLPDRQQIALMLTELLRRRRQLTCAPVLPPVPLPGTPGPDNGGGRRMREMV